MRNKNVGYLILIFIAIITIIFVWLYEALGPLIFWSLAVLVVIAGIYWRINSAKIKQLEFQNLILDTIKRKSAAKEASNVYKNLMKSDMRKADLIRKLQIIKDSIDISLSSKKRDVAESRNEIINRHFEEIEQKYRNLIKPDVFEEVTTIIIKANNEFHTALYKNIATGHIEKAGKLKTENAKCKYWNLAHEILNEGIDDPMSDKNALRDMLNRIP